MGIEEWPWGKHNSVKNLLDQDEPGIYAVFYVPSPVH